MKQVLNCMGGPKCHRLLVDFDKRFMELGLTITEFGNRTSDSKDIVLNKKEILKLKKILKGVE